MPRPMAPPMPPGNTPIGVELNPLAPSLGRPLAFLRNREKFTHMVAALGSGGSTAPKHRLVSDAPRLRLRDLPAFDKTVTLTWQTPAGALVTRVSVTAAGVVLVTGGTSVRVGLREWKMPIGRGGDHGTRRRFVCARCGSFRDALHWVAEVGWGCRGKDCLDLEHNCRHEQRWCPAIRRRARLLRKLARCAPKGLKARRLRAQIVREQAAMLSNLRRANRDLTKRMNRHDGRRRANPG